MEKIYIYSVNIRTVWLRIYALRLAIVQNLYKLRQFFLFGFWAQNVSIPPDWSISQGTKYFNTLKSYTTTIKKILLLLKNILIKLDHS